MLNNRKDNPGAFLIDGHGHADLGLVRALGERRVPVYLATDRPRAAVARSRFVTAVLPFPGPGADEAERAAALRELGRGFRHRPVFFSSGDSSAVLFSRHREQLEPYFRHHMSAPELIEGLYDKIRFAALARERGLEVPFSYVPRNLDELLLVLPRFTFPVMVKPAEKRNWDAHPEIHRLVDGNLKGVRLERPEQLLEFYRRVARYDTGMVIQDYIEGRDEAIYSFHGYVSRDGELIGGFTGQKLRTYPVHRGIGCFQLSVYEPAVVATAERALRALGYTGHAVVQLKRLPGSDRFRIFEINCRYSTWNYLHSRAGVNLPYAAYRDSLGERQAPLPRQRERVRWIDVRNDLRALPAYRRLGEWRLGPWLRSYLGNNCYAVFAWNDPLPALASWGRLLARLPGYPLRRARRLFNRPAPRPAAEAAANGKRVNERLATAPGGASHTPAARQRTIVSREGSSR